MENPKFLSPILLGTLYIVAMPIGNLEDISLRALRVLGEVEIVLAEDARVTREFLANYQLSTTVITYGRRDSEDVLHQMLTLLKSGKSVALVSDAGTPAIADPGLLLIQETLKIGVNVRAIPGANAALVALLLSGFPSGRFIFEGFPPRSQLERQAFFQNLADESRTIILYESPRFLRSTLRDLCVVLGEDRSAMIGFDLTKLTEKLFRGTLAEMRAEFTRKKIRAETGRRP